MSCRYPTGRIQEYVDGCGSARQKQMTARHLLTCPTCARAAEEYRRLEQLLGILPQREVSPGFEEALAARQAQQPAGGLQASWEWLRFRLSWRLVPTAAAAGALAMGLVAWALLPSGTDKPVLQGSRPAASIEFVQQCIEQHQVLVERRAALERLSHAPELDMVEASLNVTTGLNLTE